MKPKLLLSLVLLPASLYFSYGPPIKSIVSNKYRKELKKQCTADTKDKRNNDFCIKVGLAALDNCRHTINVLTMKNGFPKCLEKENREIKECLTHKTENLCLKARKGAKNGAKNRAKKSTN